MSRVANCGDEMQLELVAFDTSQGWGGPCTYPAHAHKSSVPKRPTARGRISAKISLRTSQKISNPKSPPFRCHRRHHSAHLSATSYHLPTAPLRPRIPIVFITPLVYRTDIVGLLSGGWLLLQRLVNPCLCLLPRPAPGGARPRWWMDYGALGSRKMEG